jgi:mRNA interferase MazF
MIVRRGDIWTVAGGPDYAGKPRPAVIVQDDAFGATASITICLLTTDPIDAPLLRLPVPADPSTGLAQPSRLMIDKVTTVAKSRLGVRIGAMGTEELTSLNQSMLLFLGLATPVRR